MDLEEIRRRINAGLKPPLTDVEWGFLLREERYRDAFESGDVEDEDMAAARDTVLNLRQVYGMRQEPRTVPTASGGLVGALPSMDASGASVPATPSDRVWAAVACLQASRLPGVVEFRRRYLPQGCLPPEEVPDFLSGLSDDVQVRSEMFDIPPGYVSGRSAVVPHGDRYYWQMDGREVREVVQVVSYVVTRYEWSFRSCLMFVLCNTIPGGLGVHYQQVNLPSNAGGTGRQALSMTVPLHLTGEEVAAGYVQARRYLKLPSARFSEGTAQAAVFAVERLLLGHSVAAIAREWSDDPRKAEAFRKEWYRAVGKVGPALGYPAVHPRGKP